MPKEMLPQIVECIPNFSEGRDKNIIDNITKTIDETEGATLLDVDPGEATNRTVVTFAGNPDSVVDAAFNAIKKASELIDMSKHKGAHPRMGACDVCPFAPVAGVTMDDCIELANRLGKRVGTQLGIPVYLYEYAAKKEDRKNLADVRKGEYEGLKEKLKDPDWEPDYGPAEFNTKSGATIIGAREFLIAYNVNLNTRDRKLATEIALNIREAGRAKRDKDGNIIRDKDGKTIKVPGRLKCTKGVGWYIDEYKMAQVSINLTNYKVTPPHIAFEECKKEAEKLGLRVTGSELVGLIPKEAMLMAGRYYLEKQGKSPGVPEPELIRVAIQSMGMSELAKFNPDEKIIEYRCLAKRGPLSEKRIWEFVDELSSDSPAPGGGSVAALIGSLASGLVSMVANLTVGKKGYEDYFDKMKEVAIKVQNLKDELVSLIDKDTEAFNRLMDTFRMPKKTDEQIKAREDAIQEATKGAISVPLEVMSRSRDVLDLAKEAAESGNINAVSDAGCSALCAKAGIESAYLNVLINLKGLKDEKFKEDVQKKSEKIRTEKEKLAKEIMEIVRKKIK